MSEALIDNGIFAPPEMSVVFDNNVFAEFPIHSTISRIEQYAGAAVGTALVTYAANHAEAATRRMGDRAIIKVGGAVVFRGCVVHGPFRVDESDDQVEMVLADDKFLMTARRVGQIGIGTVGSPAGAEGWPDVGFEVVFNSQGRPNKSPSALTFNTGSTAVYWTLRDIMNFIFTHYVASTVATIEAAAIAHAAYDVVPSHLNLVNQTALQAVEIVAQLAGESWTLIPGDIVSAFRAVRAGAGTERTVRLIRPGAVVALGSVTNEFADEISVPLSIEHCRDVYQAVSSPIVLESVYSTANGLLTRLAGFKDKQYATRFAVNVAKYAYNNIGRNLSAGSRPKRWLPHLCTRLSAAGAAYLEAADIAATPQYQDLRRVDIPVWVSTTGAEGSAQLCTGGYRIDAENGTIDFESSVELLNSEGVKTATAVSNWSAAGVWVTLATVLEIPESAISEDGEYLSDPMYEIISKPDLVPERRRDSWLPDLAGGCNAISKVAVGAEEKYVDITARLTAAAASALARAPEIESPIDVRLPFFPIWNVGDRLAVVGRGVGATGNEVITAICFNGHHQFETVIKASSVMTSVDPDKFIQRRK
jgi:hypothetical protein